MSSALLELMKDELQEREEAGIQIGIQTGIQSGIQTSIKISKEFGISKEQLIPKLMENCKISLDQATEYVEKYW